MAKQLQLRRGTTAQHSTFTGAVGEVTIDTDKKVVVVHDGSTAGGIPLAKQATVDTKVDKVTSTDNAIVRFDGTSGAVQNSSVIIDDSGNVGIGTNSPAEKLHIRGVGSTLAFDTTGGTASNTIKTTNDYWLTLKANRGYTSQIALTNNNGVIFSTNNSERMCIDSSGNLGIGVTPSAWGSDQKAIEIGSAATGFLFNDSNNVNLGANAYYNAGWKYQTSSVGASRYAQSSGRHTWSTAPSGTADNAITWTNAMTLNPNGNLLVGTTTDNGVGKLQVNGSISALPPSFGIQQQVNNHRRLYCFYSPTATQNRLKLTISGNTTYLSFVLNIVYSNLYSTSNQSAIREYSFKRLAYANTSNFSEIGTGLGSTVTVISSNEVTGGYEVVLGFNTGGYPQFDIEIVNHQLYSIGTITGEFLTA